jgi:hypothetical protein
MSHPDDSTIELFAMGALDDDADFIAHVAACDACSRKLQRQAELELSMVDVRKRADALGVLEGLEGAASARLASAPIRSRLARRTIGAALVFAAAAAVVVGIGAQRLRAHRAPESAGAAAVAVVSCPDGPKQLDCIAEAHRSGRLLEYPKGTPVAALGAEPGFSVYLEPRSSDGAPPELESLLAHGKESLETCAGQAPLTEDKPFRTGEVGLTFLIGPDGKVEDTETALVLREPMQYPDVEEPLAGTDATLSRCLRKTVHAHAFTGTGRPVQVTIIAKYVWRE